MPTYEYACPDCGHQFEVQHGFSDKGPRKCPSCGKMKLRKVFHPVGIVFKGSGFYKTDSRGKDSSATPAASGGESSGSDTSTKKSDTKKADAKKSGAKKSDSAKSDSAKSSGTTAKPAASKKS